MKEIRSTYVAAFKQALESLRTDEHDVHPEVRVELKGSGGDPLYDLLVIDILEKQADGSLGAIRIKVDPMPASAPGVAAGSVLAWDAVRFRCTKEGFDEKGLLKWAGRWIHDESPPLGPQDGLTGIIHSVSSPIPSGDVIEFEVDFGSAPMAAFEELVELLTGLLRSIGGGV